MMLSDKISLPLSSLPYSVHLLVVYCCIWLPERDVKSCQKHVEIDCMLDFAFPMVLVQIPKFKENEVYKISIGAACNLSWLSDRLVIQVLDDSTNLLVKIQLICQKGDIGFHPGPRS